MKDNTTKQAFQDYGAGVINAGREASEGFVDATVEANTNVVAKEIKEKLGVKFNPKTNEIEIGEYILSLQTDGVGTKLQIYMGLYEGYFQEYKNGDIALKQLEDKAFLLADKMLADLTGMLYDDGIKGERAFAFTNIIDTNTTKSERAKIFYKAFKKALGGIIEITEVKSAGGETADLGENGKYERLVDRYKQTKEKGEKLIQMQLDILKENLKNNGSRDIRKTIVQSIRLIQNEGDDINKYIDNLNKELELNLGGSVLLAKKSGEEFEKMEKMEVGDIIMTFSENPDENNIIGPRSNGLTLIRKCGTNLLGPNWINKTFEDYIEAIKKIDPEKVKKVNALGLGNKLKGLKMGDIATGRTTSFNKVIGDAMLGGIDGKPNIKMSGNTHGTGSPVYKLYNNGLNGNENLKFVMDVEKLEIPDIFKLYQIAFDLTDEEIAESWNMGMPYHIFVKPGEEDKAIKIAKANGYTLTVTGKVEERKEGEPSIEISGVGLGNSTIITYDGKEIKTLEKHNSPK